MALRYNGVTSVLEEDEELEDMKYNLKWKLIYDHASNVASDLRLFRTSSVFLDDSNKINNMSSSSL
jgi:hypothetical protein